VPELPLRAVRKTDLSGHIRGMSGNSGATTTKRTP
jgi:hypothetical protein